MVFVFFVATAAGIPFLLATSRPRSDLLCSHPVGPRKNRFRLRRHAAMQGRMRRQDIPGLESGALTLPADGAF